MQFTSTIIAAILATPLLAVAVPGTLETRNYKVTPCVPGYDKDTGCTIYCDKDRVGSNIDQQYLPDGQGIKDCAQLCRKKAGCVTVQLHESIGLCYLKNSLPTLQYDKGVDTADCPAPPASGGKGSSGGGSNGGGGKS